MSTTTHHFARRIGMLALGLAAAGTGVATTAGSAHATPPGCGVNCITSFQTSEKVADKVNLTFTFTTAVPTATTVAIAKEDGTVLAILIDPAYRTSHEMTSPYVMEQGVDHQYSVTVTDQAGNVHTAHEDVYAVERRVSLTVTSLKITNDGDWFGPGEIRAGMRLGTSVATILPLTSLEDPAVIPMNTTLTAAKASWRLGFNIEVQDEDFEFGPCRPATFTWGTGTSGCIQRATASSTVSSGLVPIPETRTLTLSRLGSVAFQVTVTVTIDYV